MSKKAYRPPPICTLLFMLLFCGSIKIDRAARWDHKFVIVDDLYAFPKLLTSAEVYGLEAYRACGVEGDAVNVGKSSGKGDLLHVH